jgi:hypothetical protein
MVSNERPECFFILFYDAYLTEFAQSVPPRIGRRGTVNTVTLAVPWRHIEVAGAAIHLEAVL